MEFREFTGKNVEDAITNALVSLETTSDNIEYEVISKGSNGVFGIGSKPAKIKAKIKEAEVVETKVETKTEAKIENTTVATEAKVEEVKNSEESTNDEKKSNKTVKSFDETKASIIEFLTKVFEAMNLSVTIEVTEEEDLIAVNLVGDDMGTLIGKRGQTLDSLQYLVSLVVNKNSADYIRVKLDTENYRQRRKDTLENLAKNLAFKVKRTKRPVSLEPMNPFERRIIHSALQNDKYVTTKSEGEEPYRHVVVIPKKNY